MVTLICIFLLLAISGAINHEEYNIAMFLAVIFICVLCVDGNIDIRAPFNLRVNNESRTLYQ